jgi:phosphate transport system ATP-binding protein
MEESEQDVVANLPRPETTQQAPSASGPPVFNARNVSIWYSAFKAVTDVSLDIHEHEITAFIGSSGSGKTTVLRAFNRMNDLVPGARVEGDLTYRGESLYSPGGLPDRGAPPYWHGLPEAEPVPEVEL